MTTTWNILLITWKQKQKIIMLRLEPFSNDRFSIESWYFCQNTHTHTKRRWSHFYTLRALANSIVFGFHVMWVITIFFLFLFPFLSSPVSLQLQMIDLYAQCRLNKYILHIIINYCLAWYKTLNKHTHSTLLIAII